MGKGARWHENDYGVLWPPTGWVHYDTAEEVRAMNHLHRGELRLMMNLFQRSVKLIANERRGSRLIRRYA